jgi:spore coat protein U-like protein
MKNSIQRRTRLSSSLLGGALLSLAGLAGVPAAHADDNATASATAVVLQPIAVAKFADLNFGNVVAGNGIVTVSTSGVRTKDGGTALPLGVTPAAARFDVTGSANNTFAIDYTGSDTELSDGGTNTMAVDWITEAVGTTTATGKTDESTDAATGTLNSGVAYIFVGGKLTVGAPQAAGTYTGSVKVTVAYN